MARARYLASPRCRLEEALAIGYGGFEAYGFHALEGLQALVEMRLGGETGVARVETVTGERIWKRRGLAAGRETCSRPRSTSHRDTSRAIPRNCCGRIQLGT